MKPSLSAQLKQAKHRLEMEKKIKLMVILGKHYGNDTVKQIHRNADAIDEILKVI